MHIPVLLNKTIEYLNPKPNENFIDCTIGEAGHSKVILKKNKPKGRVLGIDRDKEVISRLELADFQKRLILVNGDFSGLKKIVQEQKFGPVNGVLFDLGLSSWQIEESGRGFTFQRNEPLLMNFEEKGNKLTAETILNQWSKEELFRIFKEYGEERYSWKIAWRISEERKVKTIKSTFQLLEIIKKSVPYSNTRRGQINRIAARIFQALRIATNNELDNLSKGLEQALDILEVGGRIVVISFNSLEDRIVKKFFRPTADQPRVNKIKSLTKKPIVPNEEEVKNNSRSRSAKLRAATKIQDIN